MSEIEQQLQRLEEHRQCQLNENRFASKRMDVLETRLYELEQWTRADEERVYGRLAILKERVGALEKLVVEPTAQSVVDKVGVAYRPLSRNCSHCQRPYK